MISNIEYLSPLGKSDHCVIQFDINCQFQPGNSTKTRKCFDKGDYHGLNQAIKDIDWEHTLSSDDVDSNWRKFHEIIKELDSKYIPTRTIKLSNKGKRCFPVDVQTRISP